MNGDEFDDGLRDWKRCRFGKRHRLRERFGFGERYGLGERFGFRDWNWGTAGGCMRTRICAHDLWDNAERCGPSSGLVEDRELGDGGGF